jgi:hypothetical protein
MDEQKASWRRRWMEWAERVEHQGTASGLGEITGALRSSFAPLAPIAAELVWLVQPAFALFGEAAAIDALADLLADPGSDSHLTTPDQPDSPESR